MSPKRWGGKRVGGTNEKNIKNQEKVLEKAPKKVLEKAPKKGPKKVIEKAQKQELEKGLNKYCIFHNAFRVKDPPSYKNTIFRIVLLLDNT